MSCSNNRESDLIRELRRFIGETVTIFTTSGGESGRGFTGVLIGVTSDPVVRLLSAIGSAPSCVLGSCCDRHRGRHECDDDFEDEEGLEEDERGGNRSRSRRRNNSRRNRIDCDLRSAGAIVDIPVDRIAAFVHNAIR
jgi:hypothetical protein